MEYCLKYVLTDREYAKLAARIASKPKLQTVFSSSDILSDSDKKSEHAHSHWAVDPAAIRPFVRLFIKAWAGSALLNRTLLRKRATYNPTRIAALLVLCAACYRYSYNLLKRPAISGAVAGLILAAGLPSNLAAYLALYFGTKVCEWGYNYADDQKHLRWKPRIIGTWALFPLAFSQLFYTMFMHPEQTPSGFKRLIVLLSGGALTPKVPGQSVAVQNLGTEHMILAISRAARDGFPSFRSPVLYAFNNPSPSAITDSTVSSMFDPPIPGISELLLTAHPGNKSVLGSLIHPDMDSDAQFWTHTLLCNTVMMGKYLVPLYMLRAYFGKRPWKQELITALRTAVAYSMIATTAFGGIQLSRYWLGAKTPRALRFRLIGLFSGLWSVLIQGTGHAQFLYATRLAVLSAIPPRLLRPLTFALLPLTLAASSMMIDRHPTAVSQRFYMNLANWLQTGKWRRADSK